MTQLKTGYLAGSSDRLRASSNAAARSYRVPAVKFLDDSLWLLSVATDFKGLRLWDVANLATTDVVTGDFEKICFSRDGHTLVAVRSKGSVLAFDAPAGKEIANWKHREKYVDAMFCGTTPGATALLSADTVDILDVNQDNLGAHKLAELLDSAYESIAVGWASGNLRGR